MLHYTCTTTRLSAQHLPFESLLHIVAEVHIIRLTACVAKAYGAIWCFTPMDGAAHTIQAHENEKNR
eukprot:600137-Pelagomonas_calceolata.AAC.3